MSVFLDELPPASQIDIDTLRKRIEAISTIDPRETALSQLRDAIKSKIDDGASVKQIAAAIAPALGGDEKWIVRKIQALRARRGGGRPPKAKPAQAGGAEPAAKPPRGTLRLKPAAQPQQGEGA
jgi:hypothetical protein